MKRFKGFCTARLVLAAFALFQSVASFAYVMNIEMKDGSSAEFLLSQKPVVTYNSGEMLVTLPDGVFSYSREDVGKITFNESNSVSELGAESARFELVDNILILPDADAHFTIYDVAGHPVINDSLSLGMKRSIDLNTLPKGVYIVNISNLKSFKIYRK